MNDATGAGANYSAGWLTIDEIRALEGPLPSAWQRPVTPAHALAFLAICACAGLAVGVGVTALATAMLAKKARDALGF